jgi:hypothetical protein
MLEWVALFVLFGVIWWCPNTQEILGEKEAGADFEGAQLLRWRPSWRWSLAMSATFFACFVLMKPASRFLYFQF